MQRALLEVLLLAVTGGLLGGWIVLRRLAFFTHAVGTATFPGLVVAVALGITSQLAAVVAALGFTVGTETLRRGRAKTYDAATAVVLVGMLALGVVLASDVFDVGTATDRLLFGTLVGLGTDDVVWSAAIALVVVATSCALWRTWQAGTFDPTTARLSGLSTALAEYLLLGLIALAVVSSLATVGALLVSALFVIPAATVALRARSTSSLVLGAAVLAAIEGTGGLLLAYNLDVPPGAAIAVIAGICFALAAIPTVMKGLQ